MKFIESRGNDGQHPASVTFSEAILSPLASYGGMYVPKSLPNLGMAFLEAHTDADYKTLARDVLAAFELDVDPTGALDQFFVLPASLRMPAQIGTESQVTIHLRSRPSGLR